MKKILAMILTFVLLVGGIYYIAPEAKEVKAEETEQIEYTTEEYTDTTLVNNYLFNKEAPVSATNSDWLFAGWFTDQYCTTAVTAVSDDITTYHAKFVDPDVLSVKLQITEGATAENSSVNMRMITTVDSLDYQQVGFEVYYAEAVGAVKATEDVEITTVYKRIVASSESGVDYNYSPKVVDTDSEYFATATLVNIANGNFEKPFHIKPYWMTYDGVRVYGTSRYVTITDDALSTVTTVNVPVKIAGTVGDTEGNTYTVTEDTTASLAYHDGVYAHLRVAKTAVTSSLTRLNVTSGTDTAEAYYRNLDTEYAGSTDTADKTWYTADTSASEFVIATAADLYGFAQITDTNFYQKTVYLVADIIANEGEASATAWTPAESGGTSYNWTPIIGNGNFGGTFDGQMHSISGICVKEEPSNGYVGLFGYVNANGTIQNVELKNSYFYATTTLVGSIAAIGTGTYRNIKSSAHINATVAAGGLIGQVNYGTNTQISNCWFAGSVSTSNQYVGGIVGNSVKTGMTISDCLNTGVVSSSATAPFIGGIFGAHASSNFSATISNCLNVGEISTSAATTTGYIGQIYGGNNKTSTMTVTNSYGTMECNTNLVGSNKNKITYTEGSPEVTEITESGITGFGAFHSTNLDFENNWAIQDETIPVPKAFATDELSTTGVTKADVDWYDEGIAITDENEEITGYTYYIDNAEELFGLGVIVNNAIDDFAGDIIEISADIDLNDGWAGELQIVNGGPVAPDTPVNEWIPIGTSTYMFKGTFDGNGKNIKGLYIDKRTADGNGAGFFGNVYNADDSTQMCTIQNFGIDNSYIYVNAITSDYTGGIIGQGEANISNVYCDVDIYGVNSTGIGGFIGCISGGEKAETLCIMNNCWYNGELVFRGGTSNYGNVNIGGFIGYILFGVNNTMDHCLFTGEVNYKTGSSNETIQPRLGGFVGRNNNTNGYISISDSLSAGTITLASGNENTTFSQVGSIMGSERATSSGTATCLPISNVYVSADYTVPAVYGSSTSALTSFTDTEGNATTIDTVADWTTGLQNLNENYWAMTETIPVLKNLVDYTDSWAVLP